MKDSLWQQKVEAFMRACDFKIGEEPGVWVNKRQEDLSYELIEEEFKELEEALLANDTEEIIDGLGDLIFVCLFAASSYGVDLAPFFAEITRANLQKTEGPKDPETGKQLKPEGWKPPDIRGCLERQRKVWEPSQESRQLPNGNRLLWQEDDATPGTEGHETLRGAWKRLYGTEFDPSKADSAEDVGDGVFYRFGKIVVFSSMPGHSSIEVEP